MLDGICFLLTAMLFTTSFTGMIIIGVAMGVSKGARTVYMNIVIPSYVPIERLAFASGIQMLFNGITIITIGSLLGKYTQGKLYTARMCYLKFHVYTTTIHRGRN